MDVWVWVGGVSVHDGVCVGGCMMVCVGGWIGGLGGAQDKVAQPSDVRSLERVDRVCIHPTREAPLLRLWRRAVEAVVMQVVCYAGETVGKRAWAGRSSEGPRSSTPRRRPRSAAAPSHTALSLHMRMHQALCTCHKSSPSCTPGLPQPVHVRAQSGPDGGRADGAAVARVNAA